MYFQYVVNVEAEEPIMLLNRHIGYDETDGPGIDGSSFQSELLALDTMGKKRIQVWINSPGGSVIDGMSIYNAILKSKTKVDTYCAGICASIAGVIFQAGRNRIMSDYGLLMYHNPYNPDGTRDEGLNKIKDSLVAMIAGRCSKSEDEIRAMMDKTTWINAGEAVASGLADRIESSTEYNRKRMVQSADLFSPEDAKGYWKVSNEVLNKLIDNNKPHKMLKVANKLGLQPEASEEAILNAVTEVQNKLAAAEAKNKENEDKLLELEIAAENKQKELDALNAQIAEAKNKAEAAEAAAKKVAAENMVKDFAKAGRIKNEEAVITKWVNLAIEDIDGTKAMIEELPINSAAPKIEDLPEPGVKAYNMSAMMFEINQRTKAK